MPDIKDPRILWFKFGLFIILGALACGFALLLFPSWRLATLMALAIWSFCRAYYFAFYVLEHYLDPSYRFAGLSSAVKFVMRGRSSKAGKPR